MRPELQRFIATFRQLEQQQFRLTTAEEKQWNQLRSRLASKEPEAESLENPRVPRVIAVANLYPRAGASFIASNFGYYLAANKMPTILCELPNDISYYYFALDSQNRRQSISIEDSDSSTDVQLISLLSGNLLVNVDSLHNCHEPLTPATLANWFLSISKRAPYVVIDLSSRWHEEMISWMIDWIDEIWLIFDADIPTFTQALTIATNGFLWEKYKRKVKIIGNRWNAALGKPSVNKRVMGTLSLWTGTKEMNQYMTIPMFPAEQISRAQLSGRMFLELYPDAEDYFAALAL